MPKDEVQCSRCWAWEDRGEHHTCSEFHLMLVVQSQESGDE